MKKLLLLSVGILSFIFFGGFVLNESLQRGMNSMELRLGADLMIVPADAKETAEDILLEGSRGYFYFDRSVYEAVSEIDGVEAATPQFYLKSLSADCCSSEVEIIFFDPETDFLIEPWIGEAYTENLDGGKAIIGNSVSLEKKDEITLFGKDYEVAARLAKTGTAMDDSVYFVFDALPQILSDAEEAGVYLLDSQKKSNLISTVFINVADGYETKDILKSVHTEVKDEIGIVYPKQMAQSLSGNLSGIYSIIRIVLFVILLLSLFIMIIIYLTSANERKREFSLFRILGASRKAITLKFVKEVLRTDIVGGITGCGLAALIILPFGSYIGKQLNMPYLGPTLLQVLEIFFAVLVVTMITGVIAAFYPVAQIWYMEPYEALRKEGE
jgi:putative ABC transport system permease protein